MMKLERIGPYTVMRPLDRRPDSRVFLTASPAGAALVVEIVPLAEVADAERRERMAQRFREQAARLAALDHPGIASLADFGAEDGVLWWASAWVDGTSFAAHGAGPAALAPADAVELVALVAEALAAAHEAGVVHGAVRPSRLLRVGSAAVKVVGFRPGDPGGDPLQRASGAVGYLSPEQVRGSPIDARSDLFSLAVVLFELLTGGSPFPGQTESTLYRIVHEDPADPAAQPRPVGPELRAFLLRALAREPDQRFPTAPIFAEALRRAGAAEQVEAALGPAESRPRTSRPAAAPRAGAPARSSLFPFVAGAFAVLALVAVVAWWLARQRQPPPEVWLEAQVRTEPAGLEVRVDGGPLDPSGRVRFRDQEPYPRLAASLDCRVVERALTPADAGQTVVLVADPTEMSWKFDAAASGASVVVDGEPAGQTPLEIAIDLCRDHSIELRAPGHRPAEVRLAAGISPLEARKQLFDIALVELPKGRLSLPDTDIELSWSLDGRRLGAGEREIELEEGVHELRYENDDHWIAGKEAVTIRGGDTTEVDLAGLELATLVVQAFPSNCKVYLEREGGGGWRLIDETPLERRVAAGRYRVKVVSNTTGQEQVRDVELRPGDNAPVRVSFGAAG